MSVRLCRWLGLTLALAGAAGWAVAAALLPEAARRSEAVAGITPAPGLEGGYFAPDEWVNWVHELRWAAIVLVVCATALAGAGRRRARFAPLAVGLALVIANSVLTSVAPGRQATLAAFSFAVLVIAASAALAGSTTGTAAATKTTRTASLSARVPRNALLGYAMLAAVVAPLTAVNSNISAARSLVADELVLSVGAIQGLLAVAAVCCALGVAPALSRRRVLMGALLMLGWAGALIAAGTQIGGAGWTVITLVGGGLPLVALFALAGHGGNGGKRWLGAGLAVAIAYPVCMFVAMLSGVGYLGLLISGGVASADGVPVLTAGILLGACVGMAAGTVPSRGDTPGIPS